MVWSLFRRGLEGARDTPVSGPMLAGRYQLGERLGQGTSAQVFAALDTRTGVPVAAKLAPIPDSLTVQQRADWLARMQREVGVSRRLSHPDILQLLDAGIDATHAWMVTERVHGHDLSRYGSRHLLLPEPLVLGLGARIAAALAFAHEQGVVHRDLKPANVLVDLPAGVLKLADFGVARVEDTQLTRSGMLLGTPMYMAPEQLAGTPATADGDTYALGVMLFELLCGVRPHRAATLGELLRAMALQSAPSLASERPDLPGSVVALVDGLLARDPAHRPQDLRDWSRQALALASVMERVLNAARPAAGRPRLDGEPAPGNGPAAIGRPGAPAVA